MAALVGALGTVVSGLIGAEAQEDTNEANKEIASGNLALRERERTDRINAAEKTIAMAKLGQIDQYGNRVHFIEGVGWVTENSPQYQQFLDLEREFKTMQMIAAKESLKNAPARTALEGQQIGELSRVFREDVPYARSVALDQTTKGLTRQSTQNAEATRLLNEFQRIQKESPDDLAGLLFSKGARGIAQGFDDTQANAMRTVTRTGSSNAPQILDKLGKARGEALGNAQVDAAIQARSIVGNEYNQNRSQGAQLYSMFADRGAQPVGFSPHMFQPINSQVNPPSMNSPAADLTKTSMALGQGAGTEAAKAYGMPTGAMPLTQPNFGYANTVAQGSQQVQQAINSVFGMFGGGMSGGGGGYGGAGGANTLASTFFDPTRMSAQQGLY